MDRRMLRSLDPDAPAIAERRSRWGIPDHTTDRRARIDSDLLPDPLVTFHGAMKPAPRRKARQRPGLLAALLRFLSRRSPWGR